MNKGWRWKMSRLWHEVHWHLVTALGIAAVCLGFIGFQRQAADLGQAASVWDSLYRALQLFPLESGAVTAPVPWQLQVARFLAPGVAAYTAIAALAVVFKEQLANFRIKFLSGHVTICGLGRKGMLLASAFKEHGLSVLAVDKEVNEATRSWCGSKGIYLLVGEVTDPDMLKKARINKAKYLLSVCGDDGVNAEVAVSARQMVREGKDHLLCLVHIVDVQLCRLLRQQELAAGKVDTFQLEFFNVYEAGAKVLLRNFSSLVRQTVTGGSPHILVVGLGRLGESLMIQAARWWLDWRGDDDQRLVVSVVDAKAGDKIASITDRYGQMNQVCQIQALELNQGSHQICKINLMLSEQDVPPPDLVFIFLDDESLALATALELMRLTSSQKTPIVVRMLHETGLAKLLKGEQGNNAGFGRIYPFALLDKTCRPELIMTGTHEILARSIHQAYLTMQTKLNQNPESNPSMVAWEDLPHDLQESNRRAANHIGLKLRSRGYGIVPMANLAPSPFEFTREDIEFLAETEHERFVTERMTAGWNKGAKNIEEKTSPYLVYSAELPEDIKEFDRDQIRNIPNALAIAGFEIVRLS